MEKRKLSGKVNQFIRSKFTQEPKRQLWFRANYFKVEVNMSVIYLGFTVAQMIQFLNENSRSLVLVKNDLNDDGGFRLTTYSDEFGEYEGTGSLSRIVIEAFKPFVKRAKQEREENKKALRDILKITPE